jgi:hypothetical protein
MSTVIRKIQSHALSALTSRPDLASIREADDK